MTHVKHTAGRSGGDTGSVKTALREQWASTSRLSDPETVKIFIRISAPFELVLVFCSVFLSHVRFSVSGKTFPKRGNTVAVHYVGKTTPFS